MTEQARDFEVGVSFGPTGFWDDVVAATKIAEPASLMLRRASR